MPELRKDPIIGRWVIVSTERSRRPVHLMSGHAQAKEITPCPFCAGNEKQTPPEIFAMRKKGSSANSKGWQVRVITSKTPFLRSQGELGRRGVGMYDVMNGIGDHEVIIETPDHVSNIADLEVDQIENIISTSIERLNDLSADERFKYVLWFKNYGYSAGGSAINHSRSQLIATPVTPKRVKEELTGAKKYYDYKERCIFCDLILQELESKERIVADVDGFVAITPFASRFPFEVWILPKEHSCDFMKIQPKMANGFAGMLKLVMMKLKAALNDPPYNYILHTAPFRVSKKSGYWLTVDLDFHWHLEIIPRLTHIAGFEWGTGFYINPTMPEEAAKYLRELKV